MVASIVGDFLSSLPEWLQVIVLLAAPIGAAVVILTGCELIQMRLMRRRRRLAMADVEHRAALLASEAARERAGWVLAEDPDGFDWPAR